MNSYNIKKYHYRCDKIYTSTLNVLAMKKTWIALLNIYAKPKKKITTEQTNEQNKQMKQQLQQQQQKRKKERKENI